MLKRLILRAGFRYGIYDMLSADKPNSIQKFFIDAMKALLLGLTGGRSMVLKGLNVVWSGTTSYTVQPGVGITSDGDLYRVETAITGSGNKATGKVFLVGSYARDNSVDINAMSGSEIDNPVEMNTYSTMTSTPSGANNIQLWPENEVVYGGIDRELSGLADGAVVKVNGAASTKDTTGVGVFVKDVKGYRFVDVGDGETLTRKGNEFFSSQTISSANVYSVECPSFIEGSSSIGSINISAQWAVAGRGYIIMCPVSHVYKDGLSAYVSTNGTLIVENRSGVDVPVGIPLKIIELI